MPAPSRLHRYMAKLVVLEANLETTLDRLSKQAFDHPDVAALIRSFQELSGAQRQTLEARLQTVAGDIAVPDRSVAEFDGGGGDHQEGAEQELREHVMAPVLVRPAP